MSDKSRVAGVIDRGGGLRVVVAPEWHLPDHVGPGERLFVVPDLEVECPVPHHQIADVVNVVKMFVAEQTST